MRHNRLTGAVGHSRRGMAINKLAPTVLHVAANDAAGQVGPRDVPESTTRRARLQRRLLRDAR